MRKGFKTSFSMIITHAAVSHSSKGKKGRGQMKHGIIPAASSKRKAGKEYVSLLFVLSKKVQCQWSRTLLKKRNQLLQSTIRDYWQ